jgi:Domain of unknown function (DUF3291)
MPLVSITRLRVRAFRYLPAFLVNAFHSARQAKLASGNLAITILSDSNFAFWNRTVWDNEASMRTFLLSRAHGRVMPRLLEWCDEASVVHWMHKTNEVPTWREAHRRMQTDGRRSKVNHPSEAQERFDFPQPRITAELRFK